MNATRCSLRRRIQSLCIVQATCVPRTQSKDAQLQWNATYNSIIKLNEVGKYAVNSSKLTDASKGNNEYLNSKTGYYIF